VLRVLFTRRWLGALALAAVFCVVAIFLGRWQWHRYEVKDARADRINSHYDSQPVPLRHVLPRPGAALPLEQEWTPVIATGRYDPAHLLLVRNRPNNGTYGYEVVVPLRVRGGGTLLVDRGWVDNGRTAKSRPDVPPTPRGTVTVTGWLREGEQSLGRSMPAGQLASINIKEAAAQVDGPVFGAYVEMKHEQGPPGEAIQRPAPLEAPDTSKGPHLAYTIQWWVVAPVGFVLVFLWVRREVSEREEAENISRGAAPKVPRPKKVRIWDEEDW
jgi:cytochrome oxidase assembly protein ShyY1